MGSVLHEKKKRLKALSLSETSTNIDEMIHLASRKLYPIIEMLVDSSNKSEHFLTTQEFDDAAVAANIISEICKALVYADIKINTKSINFSLDKQKTIRNDHGKIYVETGLLLQLIDLYNILEDAKDIIDEFYRSIGINSFVQTESSVSMSSQESLNPNKIILRLTKPLTKSSSSFGLLSKNFIVMPSTTSNEDLKESKSAISTSIEKDANEPSIKKGKSTGSFADEHVSEVTDVYGAKRVIVKCIYDLQEVSKYLGTERKDAETICSRVEVDSLPTSSRRNSAKSYPTNRSNINRSETTHQPLDEIDGQNLCCCPECFADIGSRADLQECDDDKVIICIKGCNEDEGDVQIVIRQCPDCKKVGGPASTRSDKSNSLEKGSLLDTPRLVPSRQSQQNSAKYNNAENNSQQSQQNSAKYNNAENNSQQSQQNSAKYNNAENNSLTNDKVSDNAPLNVESISLHTKGSQGSYVCSEEEEDDVVEPKQSILLTKSDSIFLNDRESLPKTRESVKENTVLKQSNIQEQSRAECSKIRMFETTNLCLETDTGQELVISVTVTPREFENRKLSLRDIFSEDEYAAQERDKNSSDKRRNSSDSASRKSLSLRQPSVHSSYFVEDKVIPLGRTKICSSVDFNVTTLQTRIRDKGIQHKNAKIMVELRELGIDNLLRACRPAKCCRKAVLDEKMKKCLPYPPSLRSLPLDENDMDVINQSLQMSLQKVKNSTNLKKDFYANYTYSMKPIQTIMYFFVEQAKNIPKPVRKNKDVTQKLSYYINLVKDVEFERKSEYNILYFDVEKTYNKNLSTENKKKTNQDDQNIHNQNFNTFQKGILDPSKWKKDKYNTYEERPMLGGYANPKQNNRIVTNQTLNPIKTQCKIENDHTQIPSKSEMSNLSKVRCKKNTNISKIPVYIRNIRTKYNIPKNINNIELIEKEVYDISLVSLPREAGASNPCLFKESKSSSTNNRSEKEQLHKINKIQQIEQSISKSTGPSKFSLLSNYVVRKTKRKKKEFFLSRSKSDISLNARKNKCKQRATNTETKDFSNTRFEKKILGEKCGKKENKNDISLRSNDMCQHDSSKMLLNYFSKMLYKTIVKEAINENVLENMKRNKNLQNSCTETTDDKSLYEIYNKFSNKNVKQINNFGIKNFESTHHDLKAKKSQSCMVISKKSKKKVCVIENLAIQTSLLFGAGSKQCQTSNSLLAYVIHPTIKPEERYIQKKRIFKKIYNNEALSGIQNSCDQLEKFVVIFRSDHSLKSNVSDNIDFLSSASERSERSFQNVSDLIINESLQRLKETLENYETVKNEIAQGSLQAANVNPIEYFVYQMCACNKVNKKPSVMQKLISKSKGMFSSVDWKDLGAKYRNQRHFFSMSSADRQLCYQCGCYISKCTGNKSPEKKLGNSSSSCQCFPDDDAKRPPNEPHKSPNYTTNNFSKTTNASMTSLRSLKSYFKKSLSNIKCKSRNKKLGPCTCDKGTTITKNVETICVPEGIKITHCPNKNNLTGTTKDSTTQKCECQKCNKFSEDGTCCCSHCLGCLDKTCDAKPDKNNIGTSFNSMANSDLKGRSEGTGDVINTDTDKSTQLIENRDSSKTAENTNDVKGINNTDNAVEMLNDNVENNNMSNTHTTGINKTPTPDLDSPEIVPTSEHLNPDTAEPSDNHNDEEIENIANNDSESRVISHDTTSYYLLTSSPNMFNQFGLRAGNPFEQHLLNFPRVNLLRLDNSQTFLNH